MKFGFRSESFKRKFSLNLFAYNVIIGFLKKKRGIFSLKAFEQRSRETWIEIYLWV